MNCSSVKKWVGLTPSVVTSYVKNPSLPDQDGVLRFCQLKILRSGIPREEYLFNCPLDHHALGIYRWLVNT